jgi:excisionase family DNA binding protein
MARAAHQPAPKDPTPKDVVAVAGQALVLLAEMADAQARTARVIGEMLLIEADARAEERGGGKGLSVLQCAERLGLESWHIHRAIKAGELRAERHGPRLLRIQEADLERYRRSRRTGSAR